MLIFLFFIIFILNKYYIHICICTHIMHIFKLITYINIRVRARPLCPRRAPAAALPVQRPT